MRDLFRVLLKHFFDRFFDNELVSRQGDMSQGLAKIAGVRSDWRPAFGDRDPPNRSQQRLPRAAPMSGLFFIGSVDVGADSGQCCAGLQSV